VSIITVKQIQISKQNGISL